MTTYLTRFTDGWGFFGQAALLSTTLLIVALSVDLVIKRRVLLRDTMWSAVLALMLLAPTTFLLLPTGISARLKHYASVLVPPREDSGTHSLPTSVTRLSPAVEKHLNQHGSQKS